MSFYNVHVHKEEAEEGRRHGSTAASTLAEADPLPLLNSIKTEICDEMDHYWKNDGVNWGYREVSIWYKCLYCHILLEDMINFLDHQEDHKQNQACPFLFKNSLGQLTIEEVKDFEIFIPLVKLVPLETSCLKYQCEIYLPSIVLTQIDSGDSRIMIDEPKIQPRTRRLIKQRSVILKDYICGEDDGGIDDDNEDVVIPYNNAEDDNDEDYTVPEDVELEDEGEFDSERIFPVRRGRGRPRKYQRLLTFGQVETKSKSRKRKRAFRTINYICRLCKPYKNFQNKQGAYLCHIKSTHRVNGFYQCPHCPFNTEVFNEENKTDKKKTEIKTIMRHIVRTHGTQVKDKFECEVCHDKIFTELSDFRSHMDSTHFFNGVYECPLSECYKKFALIHNLNRHFKRNHQFTLDGKIKNNTLMCLVASCWKKFSSVLELEEHTKGHNRQKELINKRHFKCPACEQKFTRIDHLRRHFHMHESTQIFVCKICGRKSYSRPSLESHLRLHLRLPKQGNHPESSQGERLYRVKRFSIEEIMCKLSGDKANDNLTTPTTIKTEPNEAHSNAGGSKKKVKLSDLMVVKVVNKMVADVSTAATLQPTKSQDELNSVHPRITKRRYYKLPSKLFNSFPCTLCNLVTYSRPFQLRQHIKLTHSEAFEQETIGSNARLSFMCGLCGFQCQEVEELNTHANTVHSLCQSKKFNCTFCGLMFDTGFNLNRHLDLLHENERKKKHMCQMCGRKYTTLAHVRRHQVTKFCFKNRLVDLNELKCMDCGVQKFNWTAYRNHVKIHTMSRPQNVCQLCHGIFTFPSSLRRHIRHVHGNEEPENRKDEEVNVLPTPPPLPKDQLLL